MWISLFTGVSVAVMVVGLNARLEGKYRQEHQKLVMAKQDLQRLSARLVQVQEQERRTISRELHDQVGQALTVIKLDVAQAEQGLNGSHPELIERLRRVRTGAEETLDVIRRMSMLLRPSMLDDIGLSAALGWYTKQFSASTGLTVNLTDDGSADRFPDAYKTSLYRIVQETLTNCARHGEAKTISIELSSEENRYIARIHDDGKGFAASKVPRGLGLMGIEERVAEMGGLFRLEAALGKGTSLFISIPLTKILEPA
jgi:signal transduction histidine kinase